MLKELWPTDAEQKLIGDVQIGEERNFCVGDIDLDDPKNAAAWGTDRTIRAEIIYALAVPNEQNLKKIHAKGVRLRGAKIVGSLDLEAAELRNPLWLVDCFFKEPVILTEAQTRTINLEGSHLPRLEADGLVAKGSLYFDERFTVESGLSLQGAVVHGDLDCRGGLFLNLNDVALNAEGIVTKGDVLLGDNFLAEGEVRLGGADIAGSLECEKGRFNNPYGNALNADGFTIKGDVHLSYGFSAKGVVRFRGADVGGDFHCTEGKFERPDKHQDSFFSDHALNADGLKTKGDVFLDHCTAQGEVRFSGADIGSDLRCTQVHFIKTNKDVIYRGNCVDPGNVLLASCS